MAVRHDVENLIRRGNIFYWRARVPLSFIRCTPGSRLSLSLQVSDHKKAQMIARQLNMRLAEMKLKPKEIMSDREQLQTFFEHIRNAMLEDLEDKAPDIVGSACGFGSTWFFELAAIAATSSTLSFPFCAAKPIACSMTITVC